jgi:hypothetical protein
MFCWGLHVSQQSTTISLRFLVFMLAPSCFFLLSRRENGDIIEFSTNGRCSTAWDKLWRPIPNTCDNVHKLPPSTTLTITSNNVPFLVNLSFECGFFTLSNSTQWDGIKSHCALASWGWDNDLTPKNLLQNTLTYTNLRAWC